MSNIEPEKESCVVKTNLPTCLRDYISTLLYLMTENSYAQAVLSKADSTLIELIQEIANNILYGTLTLSERERVLLTTNKPKIKQLIKSKNPRLYLTKNHDTLVRLLLPPAVRA